MTSSAIDPEDIGILLEDGAKSVGQLAGWLKQPVPAVLAVLTRMGRAGQVERVGPQRLWALTRSQASRPAVPTAASTVGAAAPADRSRCNGPRRTPEPADSDGPALDDDDAWDELAVGVPDYDAAPSWDEVARPEPDVDDQPAPRRPGRKPKALRQAPPPSTSGPAWWVGLSREQHRAEIDRRKDTMGRSREAQRVTGLPR